MHGEETHGGGLNVDVYLTSTRRTAEVKGGNAATAFPTSINAQMTRTQIFFVPSLEIYVQGFPTSAAGFFTDCVPSYKCTFSKT